MWVAERRPYGGLAIYGMAVCERSRCFPLADYEAAHAEHALRSARAVSRRPCGLLGGIAVCGRPRCSSLADYEAARGAQTLVFCARYEGKGWGAGGAGFRRVVGALGFRRLILLWCALVGGWQVAGRLPGLAPAR